MARVTCNRSAPRLERIGIGVAALTFPGQIVEIQVNAYVPE